MNEYRVQLDVFSGPLDLLLYLIQRDELDIQDIPLAHIAEQYLAYVHMLEAIDPNAAGDFLVMAATLVELKSRALLPAPPLEPAADEREDPRSTLVRQLLEYKRFKDAARALGSAVDERSKRYVRRPADLPRELQGVDLEEVEVWDLLEAFARVMTAIGQGPGRHEVRYDDTPIEAYSTEILDTLARDGPTAFTALFDGQTSRAEVVGRFLALLELIRARRVRAEQDRNFGVIYLFILDEIEEPEQPLPAERLENGIADDSSAAPLAKAEERAAEHEAAAPGPAESAGAATEPEVAGAGAIDAPARRPDPETAHEPAQ